MRLNGKFFSILIPLLLLACTISAAREMKAYIDIKSKIIVGRDEAYAGTKNYADARDNAIEKAKSNIRDILSRQPVNIDAPDSDTISEFLSDHPDREQVLDNFIDTAKVFSEIQNEDGYVEVTLILPVEGATGYKAMLAMLSGRMLTTLPSAAGSSFDPDTMATISSAVTSRALEEIGEPYSFAILDFYNDTGIETIQLGMAFSNYLRERLRRNSNYLVLSEEEYWSVLEDENLTPDDIWYFEATDPLRIDGVDCLVMGAVSNFEPSVKKESLGLAGNLDTIVDIKIDLRVLNAKTGRWLYHDVLPINLTETSFTTQADVDIENFYKTEDLLNEKLQPGRAFKKAVDKTEDLLRTAFPLQGYVLRADGDRIYINLTSEAGIAEGDVLGVYRMGDVLTDPVSGEEVDRIRDRLGTLKVAEVHDTYSRAVTVDIPLEPVKAGDLVAVEE